MTLADEDTYSEVLCVIVDNVEVMAEENVLAAIDLVTARSWIIILLLRQLFGSDVPLSMFTVGYTDNLSALGLE